MTDMSSSSCSCSCSLAHLLPFVLSLLFSYVLVSTSTSQAQTFLNDKGLNSKASAFFVFGDSTVDPGNNNHLSTPFKGNFAPYGRDFTNQTATGRFTNGKLSTDFIASYVGVKEYVPPYLDETLSMEELMTGVSFASAGSGYDPLTAQLTGVIQMSKELDYFREYKTRLEGAIGKARTQDHIEKALFLVSAGTNDFVVNYYTFPFRRTRYNITEYEQFLMQNIQQFYQGLWELGARRIAVIGLAPMGCLPIVITLNSRNIDLLLRGCIDRFSSVARDYNQRLQSLLTDMNKGFQEHGGRIHYVDIYKPVMEMIERHSKFGFEVWKRGCCGTGLMETSFLCNRGSFVCSDASKYMFWDSIHPTERTYYLLFQDIRPTIDLLLKD